MRRVLHPMRTRVTRVVVDIFAFFSSLIPLSAHDAHLINLRFDTCLADILMILPLPTPIDAHHQERHATLACHALFICCLMFMSMLMFTF